MNGCPQNSPACSSVCEVTDACSEVTLAPSKAPTSAPSRAPTKKLPPGATSAPTPPIGPKKKPSSSEGLSGGDKAAIAICVLLAVAAIAGYVFYSRRAQQGRARSYSNIAKLGEPLLEEGNNDTIFGGSAAGGGAAAVEMQSRKASGHPANTAEMPTSLHKPTPSETRMSSGDEMFKVRKSPQPH